MRLLFVSFMHPWPGDVGGRQRLLNVSRELARRHEVTMVNLLPLEPPPDPPDRDGWDRFAKDTFARVVATDCREWLPPESPPPSRLAGVAGNLWRLFVNPWPRQVQNWMVPKAVEFFRRLAKEVPHDVVWVDKAYIAVQARAAGLANVVVDLMELESVNAGRALAGRGGGRYLERAELRKLTRFEARLPEMFWRLVVCSPKDAAFFGPGRPNVYVVPNGITPRDPVDPAGEEDGNLLFVGVMDYAPNRDAVLWFAREVLPRVAERVPAAALHVVGLKPPDDIRALHDGKRVVVHGGVPDVGEYYRRAAVVVAPIRLGSGTRLKVLEALNLGKALVASEMAAEGLGLRPGVDFLQPDSPAAFADACVRLLGGAAERRRLAAAGHAEVRRRFLWDTVGEAADQAVTP
ncbi:MAG: hypothetical protein C0501_27675 [Isosphaera sp.]|nr:hypothetical protein [Isosphaera sp.]